MSNRQDIFTKTGEQYTYSTGQAPTRPWSTSAFNVGLFAGTIYAGAHFGKKPFIAGDPRRLTYLSAGFPIGETWDWWRVAGREALPGGKYALAPLDYLLNYTRKFEESLFGIPRTF